MCCSNLINSTYKHTENQIGTTIFLSHYNLKFSHFQLICNPTVYLIVTLLLRIIKFDQKPFKSWNVFFYVSFQQRVSLKKHGPTAFCKYLIWSTFTFFLFPSRPPPSSKPLFNHSFVEPSFFPLVLSKIHLLDHLLFMLLSVRYVTAWFGRSDQMIINQYCRLW